MKRKLLSILLSVLLVFALVAAVACDQTDQPPAENPCANGHSWDEGTVQTPASCTQPGVKLFVCEQCGATKTEPIDPIAHNLTKVNKVEATADADGHEEYWQCSQCHKMFADEQGTTEITEPTVIPATGTQPAEHECKHVCETCGKCTSDCDDPACADKCPGHQTEPEHKCGHVCEECGKCTSDCDDPACTDKCPGHQTEPEHKCGHVCEECGKCTSDCDDPACAEKCQGHQTEPEHECQHVCPECGKCLDDSCQDPVCADKCLGHQAVPEKGLTKDDPLTPEEAIALMDEAEEGNVVNPENKNGYYVKGVVNVGSTVDTQYHTWTFTIGTGDKHLSCDVKIDASVTNAPSETNGALDGATVVINGFLELYEGTYKIGYLPENVSPTGEKYDPKIVELKLSHECQHVCEICHKCTSDCDNPACADKCKGHQAALQAGNYYWVMRDPNSNNVWYASDTMEYNDGHTNYLDIVTELGEAAVYTVEVENGVYFIKVAGKYLEAYNSGSEDDYGDPYCYLRLVNAKSSDALAWQWNSKYNILTVKIGEVEYFPGINYYEGEVLFRDAIGMSKIRYAESNFAARFEPVGEDVHVCQDQCPICHKCTSDCTNSACVEKCLGHQTVPEKGLTKDDPLTPEEAIALMEEAGDGNVVNPENTNGYYVKGVASGSTLNEYGEWLFNIVTADGVIICQVKIDASVTNKPREVGGALDGATVVIHGFLEMFRGEHKIAYLPADASPTGEKYNPTIVEIEYAHLCEHICPICHKCTSDCTNSVCVEKCLGHQSSGENLAAGSYRIVLRDETNDLVWYVTGALNNKGGLTVSHSDETVAVLTVIYENGKYTLKIGDQYLEAYLNGTYKNMRLVDAPNNDAVEWMWSAEYNTFCAFYTDEIRYLGGNYYKNQVDDLYDDAVVLAVASRFNDNPVVIHYEEVDASEHVCKHICEECGLCTDQDCQDPACAEKCLGHQTVEPEHECQHVCPKCGKCTDETCQDPACADKCKGHEEPPVSGVTKPSGDPAVSIDRDSFVVLDDTKPSAYDKYAGVQTFNGVSVTVAAMMPSENKKPTSVQMKSAKATFTVNGKFSSLWLEIYVSTQTAAPNADWFGVTIGGKAVASSAIALEKGTSSVADFDLWHVLITLNMTEEQELTFKLGSNSYACYATEILLFGESGGTVVPDPMPEHKCGHVCGTCGLCTDQECQDSACAEKCPGHGTEPVDPTEKVLDVLADNPPQDTETYFVEGVWVHTGEAGEVYGNGNLIDPSSGKKIVIYGMAPDESSFSAAFSDGKFTNPKRFGDLSDEFASGDKIKIGVVYNKTYNNYYAYFVAKTESSENIAYTANAVFESSKGNVVLSKTEYLYYGDKVTITITASEGYKIDFVKHDGVIIVADAQGVFSFSVMPGKNIVEVSFISEGTAVTELTMDADSLLGGDAAYVASDKTKTLVISGSDTVDIVYNNVGCYNGAGIQTKKNSYLYNSTAFKMEIESIEIKATSESSNGVISISFGTSAITTKPSSFAGTFAQNSGSATIKCNVSGAKYFRIDHTTKGMIQLESITIHFKVAA